MRKRKQDDFEDFEGEELDGLKSGKSGNSGKLSPIELAVTNVPELIRSIAELGTVDTVRGLASLVNAELEEPYDPEHRITVDSTFAIDEPELFAGTVRKFFTASGNSLPFGTLLCQWLAEDLKKHSDQLLFGLIDGVYLHRTRTISYCEGRIFVGTKFFWSDVKSPYRLEIPNVTDITENQELVYLIIGDLVEGLVSQIEKRPPKKKNGRRSK